MTDEEKMEKILLDVVAILEDLEAKDISVTEAWERISTHPDILIKSDNQELPEPHMHPPEGALIRFIQDLKGDNWKRVVKKE